MTLVKKLLAKSLRERYLTENFFKKQDHSLDEVVECTKHLLMNLRFAIGEKYKLTFFRNKLASAISEFKADISTKDNKKLLDKVSDLESTFDTVILNKLKINKLFIALSKALSKKSDTDKIFDSYLDGLEDNVKDVFNTFKGKLKDNQAYEPMIEVDTDTDAISYKKFLKQKYFLQIELLKLQEWVIENNHKVLILFEGRDAAGKGSNIESFTEFLNPSSFRIETFGVPTEEENKDWFKRYKKVLPEEGEIVFFDRSWYNRAVIEPAMGYCTEKQYKEFMESVGSFEEELMDKKDIILVKLWLDVSKTRQQLRFELRKRDPLGYWKFSKNDEKMITMWGKLTPYIDKMLDKTDFIKSPWIKVDIDDKLKGIITALKEVLTVLSYDDKDLITLDKDEETKVIFLDLHGPIITKWHRLKDGDLDCNKGWDKGAIKNLNTLTDETGAKIVIMSDCKKRVPFDELKKNLADAGVTGEVIGKTIDIDKHLREEQIEDWLKKNNVTHFVVLDDKPYDTEKKYSKQFVEPKHHVGIDSDDLKRALDILSKD